MSVLTQQQKNAVENIKNGDTIVLADAGTGKTTLVKAGIELFNSWNTGGECVYLTFTEKMNSAAEILFKGMKVKCQTFHAAALASLKAINPKIKIDKSSAYEKERLDIIHGNYDLSKLIQMCKVYGADNLDAIRKVTDKHFSSILNIYSLENQCELYFKKFMQPKDWSKVTAISFDDLIYHAGKGHFALKKYPFVIIDECQDANKMQFHIAYRMTYQDNKRCGRILSVGDFKQSIFGFQGADPEIMLENTKSMKSFPLTLSWRCPKEVVDHIKQKLLMAFDMEALPKHTGAIIKERESYTNIHKNNAMVLCRTNAPLVKLYAYLSKRGYNVALNNANDALKYVEIEVNRHKNIANLAAAINKRRKDDTREVIEILIEGCKTLDDLKAKIQLLKEHRSNGVLLSTVHSAKGLEANYIYVLKPHLLGEHRGSSDFEKTQERNIFYVCLSRCKWAENSQCGIFYITDY